MREEVDRILKETWVKVKIEGIKKVGSKSRKGRRIIRIRLASVKKKVEVMKEEVKLRDKRKWISDDLTEKEGRIERRIKREAEKNKGERKRLRVGNMKI